MLSGKCIVLGVTGGIAAYKAAELASGLKKLNANVRVVMTKNATKFIAPITFETLTGNMAYTDSFERTWEIEHISLAKSADLMVIAPTTANMIGKMAVGIADDLLSTTFMAMTCPVLIAPAMNAAMWRTRANQQNINALTDRGVRMIGPESGLLACGEDDIGRMSAPQAIVEEIVRILRPVNELAGRRVLVTAGPTREALDPVRYLTNHSSGKMGYAIAEAARDRGAHVTLVSGPVNLQKPMGVEFVSVTSTLELRDAVKAAAKSSDAVIQAAAPADFRPESVYDRKIKKGGERLTLSLVPNPDIAQELGQEKRPGQVLVAFAAETDHLIENARAKLHKKNADMVVLNDVGAPGAGFSVDTNVVTLVMRDGEEALAMMSKRAVAEKILDRVAAMLEGNQ